MPASVLLYHIEYRGLESILDRNKGVYRKIMCSSHPLADFSLSFAEQ